MKKTFLSELRRRLLGNIEGVVLSNYYYNLCLINCRDQWYKLIMEATIGFTRKKKQANKLNRSKSTTELITSFSAPFSLV